MQGEPGPHDWAATEAVHRRAGHARAGKEANRQPDERRAEHASLRSGDDLIAGSRGAQVPETVAWIRKAAVTPTQSLGVLNPPRTTTMPPTWAISRPGRGRRRRRAVVR